MARNLYTIAFWFVLTTAAQAACSPQTLAGLQERGVSPEMIAKMCGSTTASDAAPTTANVCATNFGVCPYRGPKNSNCTCPGPTGPVAGTGR
jgi:hypothetical protein